MASLTFSSREKNTEDDTEDVDVIVALDTPATPLADPEVAVGSACEKAGCHGCHQQPQQQQQRDPFNRFNDYRNVEDVGCCFNVFPPLMISMAVWAQLLAAWALLVWGPHVIPFSDESLATRSQLCLVLTVVVFLLQLSLLRAHTTKAAFVPHVDDLALHGYPLPQYIEQKGPDSLEELEITQCDKCNKWRPPAVHHCR